MVPPGASLLFFLAEKKVQLDAVSWFPTFCFQIDVSKTLEIVSYDGGESLHNLFSWSSTLDWTNVTVGLLEDGVTWANRFFNRQIQSSIIFWLSHYPVASFDETSIYFHKSFLRNQVSLFSSLPTNLPTAKLRFLRSCKTMCWWVLERCCPINLMMLHFWSSCLLLFECWKC